MARIAVVDDSRLARAYAASVLRQAGHEVAEVEPTSLGEVLAALEAFQPDLALLDQQMPACQGSSLVRACFESEGLGGLRVLLLTATRDPDLERRMAKLGVTRVLHKPITPADLLQATSEELGA